MKRLIMVAGLLAAGAAWACDDHVGECQIEDWRWNDMMGGTGILDGVTTCDAGEVILRLYDGEGGPFLAVERAYIEGHAFKALVYDITVTDSLAIKYSIEPE